MKIEDIKNTTILKLETGGLLLVTIASLSAIHASGPGLPGSCSGTSAAVPYIYYHATEICGNPSLATSITVYFAACLVMIVVSQMLYLYRKLPLRLVSSWWVLALVMLMGGIFLYNWLVGTEGTDFYDSRIHAGKVMFPMMACFVIPTFQFLAFSFFLQPKT